jgi:hypothetical protein
VFAVEALGELVTEVLLAAAVPDADAVADAEPDVGAELAEADAAGPDAAEVAPEPALNWVAAAPVEVTETSLSAAAPWFTITIRN